MAYMYNAFIFACAIVITNTLTVLFANERVVSLEHDGIYEILNRADNESGVLTEKHDAKEGLNLVYVKLRDNTDKQKWKVYHHRMAPKNSIELLPKLNESTALDVDRQKSLICTKAGFHNVVRTWILRDVGENYTSIMNFRVHTCLTSDGLDKGVKLAPCENTKSQQWKFKLIK